MGPFDISGRLQYGGGANSPEDNDDDLVKSHAAILTV
jgi:hypothetical protein